MRVKVSEIADLNVSNKSINSFETIQYLDTASVAEGNFSEMQLLNVKSDVIPSRAKRAVKDGTTVISTVRPNLKHYGYVSNPNDNMVVSTGFVTVDAKPSKVDSRYLYYILTSPLVTNYLVTISATSKGQYPSFNPGELGDLVIDIEEDITEQAKIAKVLSDIDSKIVCNNSICSDLEAMAKQLYNYWFVQFDFPDENGNPYKSSGGKMVWNEELKREIPEGWEVKQIGTFLDVIRGVSYDPSEVITNPQNGYVPLLKSNNLQNGKLLLDDVVYVPENNVSDEQYLKNSSLFVTMSSGSTEHVGKVAIIPYDTPYCYGAFCSKIEIQPEYRCFVSMFFMSEYFKKMIHTIVVGTSIKNINNEHLTDNLVAVPPKTILNEFENSVGKTFDKLGAIIQENQELTSLRDFLLPMLMNGQVKVGKAGA